MDKNEVKCYGHYAAARPECRRCVYGESCRYFQETGNQVVSRAKLTSYEAIEEWLPEAADCDHTPGEEPEAEEESLLPALSRFFRYLLELDNYSIGIIAEIVAPTGGTQHPCTVSRLGRLHGCSRQAMHRKILEMIARHPELGGLLKQTMYKLSRSRQSFLRRQAEPAAAGE